MSHEKDARLIYSIVVCLFVVLVISQFGLRGSGLVLVLLVPGHCLLNVFSQRNKT